MGFGDCEPRPDCVPTPRWTGVDVTLPPRQHAYDFAEIMRHDPNRAEIMEQYHGPKCVACGSRRTKRLAQGYPIRMCMEPGCGRSSIYGALVPEKE